MLFSELPERVRGYELGRRWWFCLYAKLCFSCGIWSELLNHNKAVIISLHFGRVGAIGIVGKKIITEFFASLENFRKARVIMTIGFDSKIKEFKCPVNSLGGTSRITFGSPSQGTRYFTTDVTHLICDRSG